MNTIALKFNFNYPIIGDFLLSSVIWSEFMDKGEVVSFVRTNSCVGDNTFVTVTPCSDDTFASIVKHSKQITLSGTVFNAETEKIFNFESERKKYLSMVYQLG